MELVSLGVNKICMFCCVSVDFKERGFFTKFSKPDSHLR
jgi:hypothetical protein